ncbi:Vitellogenin domain-containing protein [Sergentomyia squamirostris]
MGSFRVVLLFSCVALLGLGCVESRYLGDFKHGEFNASVYDYELISRSGVYQSGYENSLNEKLRMVIVPYGEDAVYVRIQMVESLVRSRSGNKGTEELEAEQNSKRVFEFILNDEGKLFLRKKEERFLDNFMKNFANALLFDFDKFNQGKRDFKWIYNVDQPTIYGSCPMKNIATYGKEGSAVVEQTFDPRDCSNYHPYVLNDVDGVKGIRGVSINNYRKYNLLKRETGGYFPEKVETSQKIYWKPSNKNSLTHFLEISHKITFAEAKSLSLDDSDFDFSTPHNLELVTSAHDHFEEERNIMGLEMMYKLESDTLVSDVKDMMTQVADIWNRQPIYASEYLQEIGQELTRTTAYVAFATYDHLDTIWKSFKKDTSAEGLRVLKAFYRIVPLVGTEGSVLFIRKLILDKDVSTEVAERMLSKLAGSIRLPSLKVLEAMKEIWRTTNTDSSLLAYSSTLGTALRNYPDSEKVKNWVIASKTRGIDIINNSLNDYKKVRLMILALANLRCVSLADEAILDLKNKLLKTNQDLYYYLLMAFKNTTPSDFIFDQMLEILQDPNYQYELKALALEISIGHIPSVKHFEVLARLMDTETNNELYNLFESSIRVMIKGNQLPVEAKKWLRHRDPISRSTAFVLNSPDNYPMKITLYGYLFFNDTNQALQTVYIKIYQNFYDKPVKLYSVFLRVSGVERLSSLSSNNILQSLFNDDKISYEFIFYKGDRAILSAVDSIKVGSYISQAIRISQDFSFDPVKLEIGDIFHDWHFDYYFPTDYGKNARIYFNIPWSVSTLFDAHKDDDKDSGFNILGSLNYTAQSVHGLYLYHPKLMVLQGTRELSSFHFTQQLAFTKVETGEGFNFNIELRDDDFMPLFGFRIKKDTFLHFNKPAHEILKFKDDKQLPRHIRILNDRINIHKDSKNLLLIHSDIGAKFQVSLDYYNAPAGMEEFPTTLSALMYQKPFSGIFDMEIGDWDTSFLNYLNWNFLAYSAYSYSLKATMEPCKIFQIKKYRFSPTAGGFNVDLLDKEDKLRVAYKFGRYDGYIHLLRSGPGLESVGICFRHMVDKPDESLYRFFYGTKNGDLLECPMDQFQISLASKSEFSADQIENRNSDVFSYEECLNPSIYLPARDTTNTLNCAKAATSLRDFTVNVNFKNPPKEFLTFLYHFWTWFHKSNGGIPSENTLGTTGQGEITMKADFPLSTNNMNLEVFFPEVKYSFRNLSRMMSPDNAVFNDYYEVIDYIFPSTVCTVVASEDLVKSSKHIYHNTSLWTVYANHSQVSVSVKKFGNDQLALKIIHLTQTITVLPNDNEDEGEDKYIISLGETSVDEVPMDWNSVRLRTFRISDTVFFASDVRNKTYTFIVGYNGHSVMLVGAHRKMCTVNDI